MLALSITPSPPHLPSQSITPKKNPPLFFPNPFPTASPHHPKPATLCTSASDPVQSVDGTDPDPGPEPDNEGEREEDGFEMEVEKVGKRNRRVIRSRIRVNADLETVWGVLTDYEGLADFIPGLAVSELVEKKDKFARLYQVGKQDLAFGITFDAKGTLDCYEGDLECLPSGRRRNIEFKMVEGDFQTFEGKWSIEQIDKGTFKVGEFSTGQEFQTTLTYIVELEPKLWVPVHLLEGRLCKEVKNNLRCVKEEAQRVRMVESFATTWEAEELSEDS
ncbi:uncharacterized protein M6B38_115350 [Iris pallida]|uniref:Coenzyme Q-binding protein COQ10 START domain-containing protein n=1 Tax=Iris pallida TaxID=29817 RepID=A0AAX6I3H7_IRIPA|nr:uncharacterized protein M6B38_115350 [Iris pallida]